jgi:hypothetical protein
VADSYTLVTHQSWGERLKKALLMALIGLILFLGAFLVLFYNEGRFVIRTQTLEEGAQAVISIDANQIDPANDQQLVHLVGKTTTSDTLKDTFFGLTVTHALKLRRIVEMYQWEENEQSETEELMGGGTRTVKTYTYHKIWSEIIIKSNHFQQPEGHENPDDMPVKGENWIAKPIQLGDFTLSQTFVSRLNNYQTLPMTTETFNHLPNTLYAQIGGEKIQLNYGKYYIGQAPLTPQIGDLRISYEVVRSAMISVVAKQKDYQLLPYITQAGGRIKLLEYGNLTAEDMFKHAQLHNIFLTWALRFGGFIMMFIGLTMILYLLRILTAVLPILGQIVGFFNIIISFLIAAILSLITIAMAWLYYRPLFGIALLIIAGIMLYLLKFFQKTPSSDEQQDSSLIPEIEVPDK